MKGAPTIGLYVHIPFCATKCPYCDFNTYAGIEPLMPAYVGALAGELEAWGRLLDRPRVRTVFFGGGTPSYIPSADVGRLLSVIRRSFRLDPRSEITLEANPDDLAPSKLGDYLAVGVNRLSIGVQAFDDGLLRILGRRHTADRARQAYLAARRAGFANVNLDLMYGLPHQTLHQWRRTLEEALDLGPEHLSMYCLTLEEGTPFQRWVTQGRLPAPDPDLAADMYELARDLAGAAGYRHYEISNWARPGFESRHNLTYWRGGPYLGVGPGAHSYLGDRRFWNLRSPRRYVDLWTQAEIPPAPAHLEAALGRIPTVEGVETLDRETQMAEVMVLGLRLEAGVSEAAFARRFGVSPSRVYGAVLRELEELGLIERGDGRVRLTDRGRLVGNQVFLRFVEAAARSAP